MSCRICSSALNHVNKLPANFVWEDLVNAILPQLVLDAIPSKEICSLCYGKLQKFNLYRNVYSQNEKIYAEKKNMPLCRMCKIDISSAGISCNYMTTRHINLLKIFIPDMLLDENENLKLCILCLNVLEEFASFWYIFQDSNNNSKTAIDSADKNTHFKNNIKHTNEISFRTDGPQSRNSNISKNKNMNVNYCKQSAKNNSSEIELENSDLKSDKRHVKNLNKNANASAVDGSIKCPLCTYITKGNKYRMKNHIKLIHNKNCEKFECHDCGFQTKYKERLSYHVEAKHLSRQCPICFHVIKNKKGYKKHMNTQHETPKVLHCGKCTYQTYKKKYLTIHFKYMHKEDSTVYKCAICDFQTKRPNNLKSHMTFHSDNEIHKCDHCNFQTKWRANLKTHILVKHDTNYEHTKCQFCDYKTKMKADMKKHLKYKHEINTDRLKCPHCDFKTICQSWLNKHVKFQHTGNFEMQKCELCDYKSKRKSSMNLHIRTVHGEKASEFKCPKCDHRTKYKDNLKTHIKRVHSNKSNTYACSQCSYKGKLKMDLRRHVKCVHEKIRFKCANCGFQTGRKSYLKEHIKNKHGNAVETFKCSYCNHKTKYKENLKTHIRRQHKESNIYYKCRYCDHETKYKENLKTHYKVRHGDAPDLKRVKCNI